jgi:hypothetical protein
MYFFRKKSKKIYPAELSASRTFLLSKIVGVQSNKDKVELLSIFITNEQELCEHYDLSNSLILENARYYREIYQELEDDINLPSANQMHHAHAKNNEAAQNTREKHFKLTHANLFKRLQKNRLLLTHPGYTIPELPRENNRVLSKLVLSCSSWRHREPKGRSDPVKAPGSPRRYAPRDDDNISFERALIFTMINIEIKGCAIFCIDQASACLLASKLR